MVEVGNTVVDAAQWAAGRLETLEASGTSKTTSRQWFERSNCERLIVVTAHRREN